MAGGGWLPGRGPRTHGRGDRDGLFLGVRWPGVGTRRWRSWPGQDSQLLLALQVRSWSPRLSPFLGGPGNGPGPAVPSIPDGRTDRLRDAAGLLPSSPLVTVSGVCSPHRDGTLMLNKGGGAEHYLYLTLRNLPNSGHRKLCPQRGPVVVAVSTKVK